MGVKGVKVLLLSYDIFISNSDELITLLYLKSSIGTFLSQRLYVGQDHSFRHSLICFSVRKKILGLPVTGFARPFRPTQG